MSYGRVGEDTVGIGIKICDFTDLDTNANNKRAQHVYEELGFRKLQVRENSWRNQLGELQSSIDYEMCQEDFVNFAK